MAAETNKLRIWGESLGQPVRVLEDSRRPWWVGSGFGNVRHGFETSPEAWRETRSKSAAESRVSGH